MPVTSTPTLALLAEDAVTRRPLAGTMWLGAGRRRGSTVDRLPAGGWRRAEQGSAGPLVLEVRTATDRLVLQVWGPAATPADEVAQALRATRAWAGLEDDPTGFGELVGAHPLLRRAHLQLGTPILGRLPRAAESFGRAVLGQLVQGLEAAKSTAELVRMLGTPTAHGIYAYPTRAALGAAPAHQLRRCGIALRSAGALHRFAVDEATVEALHDRRDHEAIDARLRRIPGVGVWTSAETRLYLGDADAVSYGDYHIPALVGWALGDRTETDEAMAELLAPYAPQRGRVIRLIERAARHGLVPTKPRRGPRAAVSVHRYW
ncbi:DNA-3-methyladenine glycosylase [Euzebya sp.]|uniref:DNA-3-methyladenine glycosylase family protein n=1 Tax=Euzebya sp. TaxID=1971409 RepID=UPI0035186491